MRDHQPTKPVEHYKLRVLEGLVREMVAYIEINSLDHPHHQESLINMLMVLKKLVGEISPTWKHPYDMMD